VFCSSTWPRRTLRSGTSASVPALPCRRPPYRFCSSAYPPLDPHHAGLISQSVEPPSLWLLQRRSPRPCRGVELSCRRHVRPSLAAVILELCGRRSPMGHVREWRGWLAASDVARPELAPLLIFRSNSVQFGVRRRQWSDKRSSGASITICARPL
jgi:hypothetical protein